MSTFSSRSGTADEAARIDRVDRGVRAVRGARQLGQLAREIGVGELVALLFRERNGSLVVARCCRHRRSSPATAAVRAPCAPASSARLLERIEVVAVADVDERLAPVVHLLEILHQVVGGRERDVRAIADFRWTFGADGRVEDFIRPQARARDLVDRLVEPRLVVGHVDRDRRRAGRDDAEHVAVVNQLLRNLLEQLADAAGVAEVQVQVVDEDQEDAARRRRWSGAPAAG